MTEYLVDGEEIEAKDAADLVRKMHERSHAQAGSDEAWMKQVAERAVVMSGHEIRAGNAEDFVEDMLKYGMIELPEHDFDPAPKYDGF